MIHILKAESKEAEKDPTVIIWELVIYDEENNLITRETIYEYKK
jgi:hypothetical protein